jgi:hypothetical protein
MELDIQNLNEIVSVNGIISIKCEHFCSCYSKKSRQTKFFICKKENGTITIQDLINCLDCYIPCHVHNVLDSFVKINDAQVLALFK